MLGFLRGYCASDGLVPDRKRLLYFTFVRAHLGYASEIWAPQSCISNLKLSKVCSDAQQDLFLIAVPDVNQAYAYILKSFAITLLV